MNLDDITGLNDDSLFRLKPSKFVPFKKEEDLIQGVIIGMDLNLNVVDRSGYTLLDVLSDVGGLQGILISGFLLVLSILNHNLLDSYLVSKLFTFENSAL